MSSDGVRSEDISVSALRDAKGLISSRMASETPGPEENPSTECVELRGMDWALEQTIELLEQDTPDEVFEAIEDANDDLADALTTANKTENSSMLIAAAFGQVEDAHITLTGIDATRSFREGVE